MSNIDEQLLPLDSSIKAASSPEYSTSIGYRSDLMCSEESEVFFLTSKISELEKSYAEMEKKYLRKIKELKEQLSEKNQVQNSLNYELANLAKQYDDHKSQIEKISAQIKKSLEQHAEKQQKQTKLKSTSPKNHTNNSPKRLIKKSLEMVKKQIIVQPKKQFFQKDVLTVQDVDSSKNNQQNDKKIDTNTELTQQHKQQPTFGEQMSKTVHMNPLNTTQNALNTSNQLKNGRKPLYSPPSQTNGPSPKKKLLFNSSKQLDLFSKPLSKKQTFGTINGSPQRRINISPTQKKKQNSVFENKNKMVLDKEIKNELAVIEERPMRVQVKENEIKKFGGLGVDKPSSPTNRKKTSSPESAIGLLRKNISNKNLTIKVDFSQTFKEPKQANLDSKEEAKERQTKQEQKMEIQKKGIKSPTKSSKYMKMSPEATKFSPGRKLLRNSPTHKKTQSAVGLTQKPKLFTNMREKFDDNLFK